VQTPGPEPDEPKARLTSRDPRLLADGSAKLPAPPTTLETAMFNEAISESVSRLQAAQVLALADRAGVRRASSKGRRQWFERGEVAALMKRLVKAPTSQADIVRALAQSKGYDRGLGAEDAKRFAAAAYMGIINAVKPGHAKQLRDGSVRVQ
jgi:hypothetical protein